MRKWFYRVDLIAAGCFLAKSVLSASNGQWYVAGLELIVALSSACLGLDGLNKAMRGRLL